jgi:HD-like signal output (HDOD) protein
VFQIDRLAAMPQVAWQLMEALGDDKADVVRLERIIESDPALASKVLSLANSAYYGLMQKATTIRRAVVVVGFRELQFLAMGAGLAEVFDLRKVPPGLDANGLWLHCLTVSWLGRELTEAAGLPASGEVMISGLLHDLGLLVMATHLPEVLGRIIKLLQEGVPFFEAEERVGVNHCTVGYWLAQRWGLPEVHQAAIRDHHSPKPEDPHFTSTCIIALADELAKKLDFGLVYKARPMNQPIPLESIRLKLRDLRAVARRAQDLVPSMLENWRHMLDREAR